MRQYPPVQSVPSSYATTVGRIVVHWTLVEWHLRMAAKRLDGIGIKEARGRYQKVRSAQMLDKIHKLAVTKQYRLKTPPGDFKQQFSRAEIARDVVAHAPWCQNGPTILIQLTRGKYQPKGSAIAVDRRYHPQGVIVTGAFLLQVLRDVKACLKVSKDLERETRSLIAAK